MESGTFEAALLQHGARWTAGHRMAGPTLSQIQRDSVFNEAGGMRYGRRRRPLCKTSCLVDMGKTFVNRIGTYQLSTEKISSFHVVVGGVVTVCNTEERSNAEVIN